MSSKTFLRQITRRVGNARAPCRHYWTNTTGLPPPRVNLRDLRANTESKAHNARIRKAPLPENAIQTIVSLSSEQTALTKELHATQHEQSLATEQIKQNAKNRGALPEIMAKAKELKAKIKQLEAQLADVVDRLQVLALRVPNDTHPDVPIGPELAARVLSQHGPPPVEATPQRDHVAVGRQLGLFDFEAAATVTGTSWYYLLNEGALLEMALTNYALSVAARRGWRPVTAPDVVRADIAYRCGFQPRDPDGQEASQTYHVSYLPADAKAGAEAARHPELVLAGTAEIPLAGMFAKRDLERSELPAKVIGLGRAFRAEAGARGADTRGLYRVHQFTKLELFAVTEEGQSDAMMEELKSLQTELFEGLGLTFRVLDMPTEELGASAYRKYDVEAWMPGRGSWGEISSASNCTDYQSRRLHIRYKRASPSAEEQDRSVKRTTRPFAHTLNGTAVAVPRLIVALLENGACFNEAGEVEAISLPKALQPFWINTFDRNIIRWH